MVDFHGAFKTARPLFNKVFGSLPQVALFTYQSGMAEPFDGLHYLFNSEEVRYTSTYEKFIQAYNGKTVGIRQTGTLIQLPNEYKYAHVVQKAVDMFVQSITTIKTGGVSLVGEERHEWLKWFINTTPLTSISSIEDHDPDVRPLMRLVKVAPPPPAVKYYSQIGQDKYFIENINKGKRDGFFVDVGAHDGIKFSNTYALEQSFGWKGICIEMDPDTFGKLKKNRGGTQTTTIIVNECVFSESGIKKEIEVPLSNEIEEGNDMLTRIKNLPLYQNGSSFDRQFSKTQTYEKTTKTLTQIFKENNVPSVIDYMSVDVEGADLDALKGIDFSTYKIMFLTVEWGGSSAQYFEDISKHLSSHGYKLHRVNRWDAEFVPI
jgi:FkbM family methyltransferase